MSPFPCPFCGDPMKYDGELLSHRDQGDCPIGAMAWGSKTAVERWDRRAITTRRAIEVCMSRLSMSMRTRDDMAYHLSKAIQREPEAPCFDDVDTLRAFLMLACVEASDVDKSFPKDALLGRLRTVRKMLDQVLEATEDKS